MMFTRVNNIPVQSIRNRFFGYGEIIMGLQIHPALGVRAKKTGQSQGCIRCDRTFSRDDFADAPLGDADRFGESISSNPHRSQEVFHQNFTGMDWGHISLHGFSPSVVINNFNVIGVPVFPVEADSPLVVNSDTPLTFSVASELLKPVGRRDAEEFQGCRSMNLRQFPKANPLNIHRQPGRKRTLKNFLCILGPERLYHGLNVNKRR